MLTWCITILMCLCVIQAQDELAGELGDGVGDDQESREAIRQLTSTIDSLLDKLDKTEQSQKHSRQTYFKK